MHLLLIRFCYSTKLSSLQHLHAKGKASPGTRRRWKGLLQDQSSYTAYSLLAACSQLGSLSVPATLQPSEQLHSVSVCKAATSKPRWRLPKYTADWIWHANHWSHKAWTPSCLIRFSSPHSFHKDTKLPETRKFCTLLVSIRTALLPLRCHLNVWSSTTEQIQGRKHWKKCPAVSVVGRFLLQRPLNCEATVLQKQHKRTRCSIRWTCQTDRTPAATGENSLLSRPYEGADSVTCTSK